MIKYGALAWGITKMNHGQCRYISVQANDKDTALKKFKEEYPNWSPDNAIIMQASVTDEIFDILKADNDPIFIETIRSALKEYDEAYDDQELMESYEIMKNILKIKLPKCMALDYLIEKTDDWQNHERRRRCFKRFYAAAMKYEDTKFDKSYYREAIQSFDPISIELLPDWLWMVEDLEMKYKEQYYSCDILTGDDEWKANNKKAWDQFKKTRKDFLNWFNGLLEAYGYDRFLNEDNYWKLQRIIEFKHEL